MNSKTISRRVAAAENLINIDPLLKRIYAARGISSSEELEQSLRYLLPFDILKGIQGAVDLIYNALHEQQHILIIGDFDADGATSSALAVMALQIFGVKQVSYLVPNRFEYGYGLTPEIVDVAAKRNPSLIITVDNGISSLEGVLRAKILGMKVLITDHHLPGAELPQADAIVNPNQKGDFFPSKNLAGVGVIFYVMLALRAYLREKNWFISQNIIDPNMADLLDLVALGTVADVVPLDQNNRILVQQGLKRIRAGKASAGIQALLQISKRDNTKLVASDLGYAVAPRLNAAGRLKDMSLGIECLLAKDLQKAIEMASHLDELNQKRKVIEDTMQQQALTDVNDALRNIGSVLPLGVCLYNKSWHQGVIGIVASRITERVHRPVIAFASISDTELKGSARSVPGVHIRDVLDAVATQHTHLIYKFGGHAMAAGLTLHPNKLSDFSKAFAEEIGRHISPEELEGKVMSDGELSAQELNLDTATLLREAGPWGQSFPEPLFDNEFSLIQQYLVAGKHLKMILRLPQSETDIDAIAFNVDLKKWPNNRIQKIHAAYRLDVNEFRGCKKLQLLIEYLDE